jgi:hypothetical protein
MWDTHNFQITVNGHVGNPGNKVHKTGQQLQGKYRTGECNSSHQYQNKTFLLVIIFSYFGFSGTDTYIYGS